MSGNRRRIPKMTLDDLRDILRTECKAAGSHRAWAEKHQMSGTYVDYMLNGRNTPGRKILKALNLRKVVTYEPIG